jgi:hypothetical protein
VELSRNPETTIHELTKTFDLESNRHAITISFIAGVVSNARVPGSLAENLSDGTLCNFLFFGRVVESKHWNWSITRKNALRSQKVFPLHGPVALHSFDLSGRDREVEHELDAAALSSAPHSRTNEIGVSRYKKDRPPSPAQHAPHCEV